MTTPTDRADRWILVTVVVEFLSFHLHSMLICGCHFHAIAIPVSVVPVAWDFYPLFCYRTRRERVVGFITAALSLLWLFIAWQTNIKFAFFDLA